MFSMTEWPFCVKIWKRMYTGEFTKDNSLFPTLTIKDYNIMIDSKRLHDNTQNITNDEGYDYNWLFARLTLFQ